MRQRSIPDRPMGLTGGQYSLHRSGLGMVLAVAEVSICLRGSGLGVFFGGLGLCASIALALGFWDRLAAVVLLPTLPLLAMNEGSPLAAGALAGVIVLHLLLPSAPYGSLGARGRADPAGGWRFGMEATFLAWCMLILAVFSATNSGPPASFAAAAVLTLLAIARRTRQFAWAGLGVIGLLAFAQTEPLAGLAFLPLLGVTVSPNWFASDCASGPVLVAYDGTCGLCHRAVRWILAEDHTRVFQFAPLEGRTFLARVPEEQRRHLPDSVVLLMPDGRLLFQAAALSHVCRLLGGIWGLLGYLLTLLPGFLVDGIYGGVARIRHHLFSRPPDTCPLVSDHLRSRFLP